MDPKLVLTPDEERLLNLAIETDIDVAEHPDTLEESDDDSDD